MGFSVPGAAWAHQVPALARNHRVAWFDNRGSGRSEAASGFYSMVDLATDALHLLDRLHWERAHITGVSMGGMIAQELALLAPDRVRSLALIATHPGGLGHLLPPSRGVARFFAARLRGASRAEAMAHLLFPDPFLRHCDHVWLSAVLERDFGYARPLPQRLSQLAAVLRHRSLGRLPRLASIPTLVVRPGQDLLVRPEGSDAIASALPKARLLNLPQAGHGVIRQCHRQLNTALLTHYAEADAATSSQ
jgi:pimeloyl-ACP methyl ester carboxylesterase